MAASRRPTEEELNSLNRAQINSLVLAQSDANERLDGRYKKLLAKGTQKPKTPGQIVADYLLSAAGSGAMAFWRGSNQAKIDNGEEGYDEDSLYFAGVEKDLWASLALAATSVAMSRSKNTLAKGYAPYVQQFAMGGTSWYVGMYAYQQATASDEPQEAAEVA